MQALIKERQCDIIVVGGTLEGCVAAIAAAKRGSRVMLLEKGGSLGGMASNGLCAWLDAPAASDSDVAEIRAELLKRLGLDDSPAGVVYPDQQMKLVLGEWLRDAGVTFLTHVFVSEPIRDGERIVGFTANGKTEPFRITAGRALDATDIMETAGMAGLEVIETSGTVSSAVKLNSFDARRIPLLDGREVAGGKLGRLDVSFDGCFGGLRFRCERPRAILPTGTGELLLSDLVCEVADCDALTLSSALMGMRRFAYALRDHLREETEGMADVNVIHVAPRLNAYGARRVSEPPRALSLLNNDGRAYSNSAALEKGVAALR